MSTHLQGLSPKQCFNLFKLKPLEQPNDVLQGTHKFLLTSLKGKLEDPTVDDLIEIFQVFAKGSIKRYLFKSIKKNLNLELALSIVQDLISNGPARARSLELKVVKLVKKGKKVVVKDIFQSPTETPISAEDFQQIDEVIYRFSDATDKSTECTVSLGRGHKSPSENPRIEDGYLTPGKQTWRSFQKAAQRINVRLCLLYAWNMDLILSFDQWI